MAISSTLSPGSSGPDVKALQEWLNSHGYPVAPAGQPGSYGMETDYFGPATQAALQKYQADNGIVSVGDPSSTGYGNLGPQTLASINANTSVPNTQTGGTGSPAQVNTQNLQDNYGYETNTAAENRAVGALDGFLNLLQSGAAGTTPISKSQLNKMVNDDGLMSKFINALAYGGYSIQDVYEDMLKNYYEDTGQGNLVQGADPISDSVEAPQYKASSAYDAVANNKSLSVSPTIAGLDSSVLTLPVLQLPDKAFKTLTPLSDPNSPQFRQEMEKYKDLTYEATLQIAQAQNEVDHQKALANWQTAKDQIEQKLGIQLSDNAVQAWNQLSSYQDQAADNGLAGSGMADTQVDQYLKNQLRSIQSARQTVKNSEDASKQTYYQNYASPDEVSALIASDPDKAKQWGLVAPDSIKNYLSIENLSKLFPDTPESDLEAIRNRYLDKNGNLYSQLYSNYATSEADTNDSYNEWKANQVIDKAESDAQDKLAEYDDPNNPFLQPKGKMDTDQEPVTSTDTALVKKTPATTTSTNTTSAPAAAAQKISSSISSPRPTAPTPSTTTPTKQPTPVTTPSPTPAPVAPSNSFSSIKTPGIQPTAALSSGSFNLTPAPSKTSSSLTGGGSSTYSQPQAPLIGIGSSVKNFFKNLF